MAFASHSLALVAFIFYLTTHYLTIQKNIAQVLCIGLKELFIELPRQKQNRAKFKFLVQKHFIYAVSQARKVGDCPFS